MTDDEQLLLWGGVGVGLAVLALWKGDEVVATVKDVVSRGARLTQTEQDGYGQVIGDPEQLAAAASVVRGWDVDVDSYSLARMVRSEGHRTANIRAHVALNDADEMGWTPTKLMTYSTNASVRGRYGQQYVKIGDWVSGRRYASGEDPYVSDLDAVQEAWVEHRAGIDPTDGAVKFVDISSMGGVQKGTGSYAALVERWAKDGLRPFTLPGYPSDLVVFRRVG